MQSIRSLPLQISKSLHTIIPASASCSSSYVARLAIQRPKLKTTTTTTSSAISHHYRHASTQSTISATATTSNPAPTQIIRPLVPPPSPSSGPLLSRRPDRELPDVSSSRTWLKTLPIFIALITISSLAIFNYQKSSSSTVNSILYALRTNPTVRELLGDEIYFAAKIPWIKGELNQLHGVIDISFWVKGTKGIAETKFVSLRRKRDAYFETLEWSLKMPDGRIVQLLEMSGVKDPMRNVVKE